MTVTPILTGEPEAAEPIDTVSREELTAAFEELDPGSADLEVEEADSLSVQAKKRPPSPTALELDEWSMRRGREVLDESDRLKQIFELPKPSKKHDEKVEEQKSKAELATADFHAAAFEPEPEFAEECQNERLARYMKQLFETPEFQQLHRETQLDENASEIATAQFAEQWVKLAKTKEPEKEFDKNMQCLAAAGAALSGAQEEVGGFRDACSALGMGGDGALGSNITSAQLTKMFKRVKGSESLRRICELAGRYRRFAQAQQRKKTLHGRDDVVGVTLDGDPGRLLPHELVQLDDPDLELDVMRRIVERQAMCRDFRGIEPKARGPIVVVVDESGSMDGDPIYTAKAMALALAWVARNQKRWYCLVGFSGGTNGCYCVAPPNGTPRYRDFQNPKHTSWKFGNDCLMEWLEHAYGGGTDADVPLVELPGKWDELGCPKGTTDIICITDAILHIPAQIRDGFLRWKEQEKVKLITLVMNGAPGDMSQVSDKIHCVKSLSLEEEAVGECLSV